MIKMAAGTLSEIFREFGPWLFLRQTIDDTGTEDADPVLQTVLAEVEAVRHEQLERARRRARLIVPPAILVGIVLMLNPLWTEPSLGLLIFGLFLIGAARQWAKREPELAYQAAYKDRVIPRVVASFGELAYSRQATPEIGRLASLGVLPAFSRVEAEDEIAGYYRNVPVRLSCINLIRRVNNKEERTVFSGLIIRVWLATTLSGTTVIARDEGAVQKWIDRLRGHGIARVRLEDPRFEERFEIFGTDQVEARALLTPAVMERLMTLMWKMTHGDQPVMRLEDAKTPRDRLQWMAQQNPGEPPVAVAEGNTITFALPMPGALNLLSAGSLLKPITRSAGIAQLIADMKLILQAVDAVLELNRRFTRAQ